MNTLLLLLVVIAIVYFFIRPNKTARKQPTIHFSNRRHFALLIGYVVFLLAMLVTAEIVERLHQPVSLAVDFTELHYNLSIGEIDEAIHSSQFMEKRTYPVGDTLNIQNVYDGAYIYIEQKSTDDDIIEELIFKPGLQVNNQEFSDKIKVAKPIWQDGLITIPQQPFTEIRYAQFYDAILLNQMTHTESRSPSYRGYSTRPLVVYLLVPENVEIEIVSGKDEYIEYIK